MRLRRISLALLTGAMLGGAQPQPAGVALDVLLAETPAPTLDAYRLFTDASARQPNARVVPYGINTQLFSDYALKFRYAYVPPGETVGYRADGVLDFPVGTTLVKSFGYPADMRSPERDVRLLETRLLIRKSDGWVALPYVWNAEQTKAVLKRTGAKIDITWMHGDGKPRATRYAVPNINQCKGCHALGNALVPLGPKARNLNGSFTYAGGPENQLAHWTRIGLLRGAPTPAKAPRVPVWNDPKDGTLAMRAEAYLDVNCAHCHNRAGPASNSGLFLDWGERDPVARGIGKRPVAAGRGTGDLEVAIDPGHADRSILLHRMTSTEPGVAMPELGRTLTHDEGVALVRAYIDSLGD